MKTKAGPVSVNDWMKVFKELYSKADSERTPEQMWIAVMAHTSEIGESIRKFAFESLLKSATHTFCWLCSFVNKCKAMPNDDIFCISESLPGIVSLKYPGVCGHCTEKPCKCDPVRMEGEKDKSAVYTDLLDRRSRELKAQEDYSIESYKKMFYEIYGGRVHIQTLESIGFHFLEEIGEAAVCVRKLSQLRRIAQDESTEIDSAFMKQLSKVDGIVKNYTKHKTIGEINYAVKDPSMLKARVVDAKMGLVVEIGDSFSWFCALLNKLDSISRFIWDHPDKHKTLKQVEQVLGDEYIGRTGKTRCPSCKKKPCRCVFYNLGSVERI
jgi:NTP pyrophosphatase (non-canonical NTP hydrolase)